MLALPVAYVAKNGLTGAPLEVMILAVACYHDVGLLPLGLGQE
jgi:hypothetical protein